LNTKFYSPVVSPESLNIPNMTVPWTWSTSDPVCFQRHWWLFSWFSSKQRWTYQDTVFGFDVDFHVIGQKCEATTAAPKTPGVFPKLGTFRFRSEISVFYQIFRSSAKARNSSRHNQLPRNSPWVLKDGSWSRRYPPLTGEFTCFLTGNNTFFLSLQLSESRFFVVFWGSFGLWGEGPF
jgi:hypothetical protein